VLAPYRKTFRARPFLAGIALDLKVDAQGNVVGCEAKPSEGLAKAGAAICAQAKAAGRFRPDPCLAFDYARAHYRTRISLSLAATEGEPRFIHLSSSLPLLDHRPVIFGDSVIPTEDQRLKAEDVVIQPLQYPQRALQNEVSGQVVVALTFDAEGKSAPCQPLRSRMCVRLACETCAQVKGAVQRKHPPDARPYVLSISWLLGESR